MPNGEIPASALAQSKTERRLLALLYTRAEAHELLA